MKHSHSLFLGLAFASIAQYAPASAQEAIPGPGPSVSSEAYNVLGWRRDLGARAQRSGRPPYGTVVEIAPDCYLVPSVRYSEYGSIVRRRLVCSRDGSL